MVFCVEADRQIVSCKMAFGNWSCNMILRTIFEVFISDRVRPTIPADL
jgi:hypothetical protein